MHSTSSSRSGFRLRQWIVATMIPLVALFVVGGLAVALSPAPRPPASTLPASAQEDIGSPAVSSMPSSLPAVLAVDKPASQTSRAPVALSVATPTSVARLTPPATAATPDVRTSEQRAVARYPDLAVPNSPLSLKFASERQYLKLARSLRLLASDWAEKLAAECADILAHTPPGKPSAHVSLGQLQPDLPEDFVGVSSDAPTVVPADVSSSGADYYGVSGSGSTYVNGYFRKDGTYVHGYTRGGGGGGHGRK